MIFVLMPLGGDAAGGWNEEDWGNINIDPWCPLEGVMQQVAVAREC